jgi:hypothetical protein
MADFLKAFPFISIDEYKWKLTIPQIRIMSADASHVLYLTEKQAKQYSAWKRTHSKQYDDVDKFINDLGIPIF